MSRQERISWISLAISVVVGYSYFSTVLGLPAQADLHDGSLTRLAIRLAAVAIALGIIGEILLRRIQGRARGAVDKDERDALINLKACRNGYAVLSVGVAAVLGDILTTEMRRFPRAAAGMQPVHAAATLAERLLEGPLSAPLIAQLLLLAMTTAGISIYVSRIYFYRRGY